MKKKIIVSLVVLSIVVGIIVVCLVSLRQPDVNYETMCEPAMNGECTPGICVGATDRRISCKDKYDAINKY